MKKRIIIIFVIIFVSLFFSSGSVAFAEGESVEEELSESVSSALSDYDFSALDQLTIDSPYFENGFGDFVSKLVNGEISLTPQNLINSIINVVSDSVRDMARPLIVLLVVLLIITIFSALIPQKSEIKRLFKIVSIGISIILVADLVRIVITSNFNLITSLTSQMKAVFPILISIVSVLGGASSASVLSPSVVFLTEIISNVFIGVLFPVFMFCLILNVSDSFSGENKLSKFYDFLKSLFVAIISILGSVFIFILGTQGLVSAITDSLSIKAAKYTIKNYIPYLGGYISDGISTIKIASILIKNAIGIGAEILLVISVIGPIISLVVLMLLFKLLAGVLQVFEETTVGNFITKISTTLKMLLAIVIGISLMYLFTIFGVISVLNVI
ncbi:MAG: stage III sporulation protein AE [bacterium]|nr:stage III sporulation protein AE [bacterium]